MSSKNQDGFSIVLVAIIAVLVIGLIGYVSWNAYHQSQNTASNTTPSNSTTSTSPSKVISTGVTTTTTGNYLDIRELGVNIKLDDSIKDAIYSYSTSSDGGQYAYISTQTLSNKSNGTCSPPKGAFASVTKASGTPQQVFLRPTAPVDNSKTFMFGTNTYVFVAGTGATCSQDPTIQALSNQQEATFINDFKTVHQDAAQPTN